MTFGRQVYCQILDHLIFCVPFCMAVAVYFSSPCISCILQGRSDGASRRGVPLTFTLSIFFFFFLDVSHCEWFPAGVHQVPCCLVGARACEPRPHAAALACRFLPKLTSTLRRRLLLGASSPLRYLRQGNGPFRCTLTGLFPPLGFARSHS